MTESLGQAPPPAGNIFATRLTQALGHRGLTLGRVRAHLSAQGFSVSAATLSYWSSGRSVPTRSRSRLLVAELERVLEVEPGWLLDTLGGGSSDALTLTGRGERLAEAIETHDVRRDRGWQQLWVHHLCSIGVDRAGKAARTDELVRAPRGGLQYWALAVTDHSGPAVCDEVSACRLVSSIEVEPGATLFAFALHRPLQLGEAVATSHHISYPLNGDAATDVGYGLSNETSHLVLEATFAGEMPSDFRRTFIAAGAEETIVVDAPVLIGDGFAQTVVERAQPGIHRLEWTW